MTKRMPYAALMGVVLLLGAGLVWFALASAPTTGDDAAEAATQSQSQGVGVDLARRVAGDPRAVGDIDAPVVLIEYKDFRCSFCGVHARETEPKLRKYVADGTLRIEFRDLPIFGKQSIRAAAASRAAAEQGRFWEFYRAVFADTPKRGHADLTDAVLVDFAREIGVPDLTRFAADMDSTDIAGEVQDDAQEAYRIGASSTPLFLVNDEPILGAQPASVFIEKIERLASAS